MHLTAKGTLAVVLNWNGAENTVRCVDRLVSDSACVADILVVDNGSADAGVEQLKADLPSGCRLIRTGENRGFAGGMNVGLETARQEGYEFAWLLNNDAFAEPCCLSNLLAAMERRPEVVIATPKLVGLDGQEQHVGGTVDWTTGHHELRMSNEMRRPTSSGDWLTGTAMLVRLDGLKQVGFFDERFFAYWEDVDLCTRVIQAGGQLAVAPNAVVRHLGSASTDGGKSPLYHFLITRNTWLFLSKSLPVADRRKAFLRFAAKAIEEAGSLASGGNDVAAGARLAGLRAAFRKDWGNPQRIAFPKLAQRMLLAHPWRLGRLLRRLTGRPPRRAGFASSACMSGVSSAAATEGNS